MAAREGLTLALERSLPDAQSDRSAVPTTQTLVNADRETDTAIRACLRAARRAVAAASPEH
jgi:hypothetical protein